MAVSVRVEWHEGVWQSQVGRALLEDITRRTNRVLVAARAKVPVDTARLKGSLSAEVRQEGVSVVGRVGSNLNYAIYVHEGTGIYAGRGYITPKSGRYLRWPNRNNSGRGNRRYRGGRTQAYTYARRVRGMKGTPYLRDALDAAR